MRKNYKKEYGELGGEVLCLVIVLYIIGKLEDGKRLRGRVHDY
jgi:predicted component of type VI protein secretion system